MSTPSQVLKHSELLKRLVLDRETVEEVGRVSQLLLDNQAQRVLGLTCKSGWLGKQKTFAWNQIEAIGADSVLVKHQDDHTSEITESVNPVLGSEVWTDTGNKVGKILDLLFNVETGDVVNYMFSPNGWQGLMEGTYLLEPIMISSVGDKRVIVLEKAVKNPQKYTEGLSERIGQATEFIQKDYEQTKQDFKSVKPGFQKAVVQDKDGEQISTENVEENVSGAETKLQSEPSELRPENDTFSDRI
ncbi:MAG: photosystem reaction center subunit H [Nodularia sp. (in: Bacteria)]|nr:MAG: photosystem reaction center subunit H [Nodularia sp. (in: cyanobacteria)]